MKKLCIAALLSVLSFGAVNAQSQTFVFEGDAVFGSFNGIGTFNSLQELAEFWGVESPPNFNFDGVAEIRTQFRGTLLFDTSQTDTDGIARVDSRGTPFTAYRYESFTIAIGTQSLFFGPHFDSSISDRIIITDSVVQGIDADGLELRFSDGRRRTPPNDQINSAEGFIFFDASNESSTLFSGTDAININQLVGQEEQRSASLDFFTDSGNANIFFENITLSSVSAVPEPATWLMMIVGFGVTGLALRRRQRGQTVSSFKA